MSFVDYNLNEFILEFESELHKEGFYLKKSFNEGPNGDRFYKTGYKDKHKAFGRYKLINGSDTESGYPLIIWSFFSIVDKTGVVLSKQESRLFWCKPKDGKPTRPKKSFDEKEHQRIIAEREEKQLKLQKSLSSLAKKEYEQLKISGGDANNHEYIISKNVKAARGLVLANADMKIPSYYNQFRVKEEDKSYYNIRKGDLLIPAINLDLEFVTYQRITASGRKFQRIDVSTVGAFYCLGEWRTSTKRIYLCEGYATGYSLHSATNGVVFVCFDVANIGVLLMQLKARYPEIEVIICTDNDRKKTTKVGLYKGFEYSYLYNAPFIFPVFPEGDKYKDDSDWNDMAKHFSLEDIKAYCEKQISYFKAVGKNKCIELVAKKNGISGKDLDIHRMNNKLLFNTMDLSFLTV
ncbi:hypothetical protein HLH17_06870 [Acinetobacter sp. ANC 5380]|uniref:Toprim domain-containing protein n=1 Tax=Acinetobacter terrae TaxID=2731247 RepID=A0A7Y2REP6_9GAMM|nr:hypothetical protein [Acinetobacter terrae]NNH77395.1 hypothetical protein [Acinetobacter terrae]